MADCDPPDSENKNIQPEGCKEEPNSSSQESDNVLVEGKTAALLSNAIQKSINRFIDGGRFSLFYKHHPGMKPHALRSLHEQYTHKLADSIKADVYGTLAEEHLTEYLNQLDDITEESTEDHSKVAWRPSGVPQDDVRAHLMPIKQRHRDLLQRMLGVLEEGNTRLQQGVEPRRKLLTRTKHKSDALVQKLIHATEGQQETLVNTRTQHMSPPEL